MFKVFVWIDSAWLEMGNSNSFGDAWNFAKYNYKGQRVKLTGPGGFEKVWERMV